MLHPAQKIASFFVAEKTDPGAGLRVGCVRITTPVAGGSLLSDFVFDRSPGLGCIFHRSVLCCLYQPAHASAVTMRARLYGA